MKILIGADSRSVCPMPNDWVSRFKLATNNKHEIHSIRAYYDHWLFSIYILEEHLNTVEDGHYDLAIIQAGWHDGGVCYWTEDVYKGIMKDRFNKDCLSKKIEHKGKDQYVYIDRKNEKEIFDLIKRKCKNCIFIGIHSLRKDNDLDTEFKLGIQHHYDALDMNNAFSSLDIDFFHMPMDTPWVVSHTSKDRIHFNDSGVEFFLNCLVSYVDRVNETIPSILEKHSKCGVFNNSLLYEKSLKVGSSIEKLTNKGDVVLLSKKSGMALFSEFIGCILYGRKPLVIQRPTVKVYESVFNSRMNDIKNKINPTLCICEPENVDKYVPFFKCISELVISDDIQPVLYPNPNDVAFLQLSSGTTGVSKVCEITHKQLLSHCDEYGKIIKLNKSKSIVSWLPLYHDMGLIAAFVLPLLYDCKINIIDPFDWLADPKQLLQLVNDFGGTHIWMPSFAFNYMAKNIKHEEVQHLNLSSLEQIISCSEPTFSSDLINFYNKFGDLGLNNKVLRSCYALAENIFAVSQSEDLCECTWKNHKYVSCGKVIPGVSVIIAKDGKDVTDTDDGTVMIKSSYEPHTNIKSDFYGYYNTGDIGFFVEDNLYIIGRENDCFVSYGTNVYPAIVEQEISKLEKVISGRVVCFGVLDEIVGTHKIYVCAETEDDSDDLLKLEISSIIKEQFQLSSIVILLKKNSLVKTSSGKLCRIENKKLYGNG